MRTDGIFKAPKFEITFACWNKPIYFVPLGDIHFDSYNHDRFKLIEYFQKFKELDAHILLKGDTFDGMSTSERSVYRDALHESTNFNIEMMYRTYVEEFAELITKYVPKDNILGVEGGNHYFKFEDGSTSDNYLSFLLEAKYLGVCSLSSLMLKHKSSSNSYRVIIYSHHGKGTGGTPGGSINAINKVTTGFEADIYIMGHDHQEAAFSRNRLKIGHTGELQNKKYFLIRSGSFLKGYVENRQSYVVDGAYSPASLGCPIIKLTPVRKQIGGKEYKYIDIRVEI